MGFPRQEYWSGFAISFSRDSSQPKDWTQVSCTVGGFFTIWDTRESLPGEIEYNLSAWPFRPPHTPLWIQIFWRKWFKLTLEEWVGVSLMKVHGGGWESESGQGNNSWQKMVSQVPETWVSEFQEQPDFVAMEGQTRGLIYMGWERGGGNGCDEDQTEERTVMQRNYSNQRVAEKIEYQVVTSLYEDYLLAVSLSLFLT